MKCIYVQFSAPEVRGELDTGLSGYQAGIGDVAAAGYLVQYFPDGFQAALAQ